MTKRRQEQRKPKKKSLKDRSAKLDRQIKEINERLAAGEIESRKYNYLLKFIKIQLG